MSRGFVNTTRQTSRRFPFSIDVSLCVYVSVRPIVSDLNKANKREKQQKT